MSRYIKESLGPISGKLSIEGFVGERRVFCEICSVQNREEALERAGKAILKAAR